MQNSGIFRTTGTCTCCPNNSNSNFTNQKVLVVLFINSFVPFLKYIPISPNQFLSSSTHSEHSSTKEAAQLEAQPILRPDDVKIYLVDPRDEKPCLRELSDIYKEQVFSEIVF